MRKWFVFFNGGRSGLFLFLSYMLVLMKFLKKNFFFLEGLLFDGIVFFIKVSYIVSNF